MNAFLGNYTVVKQVIGLNMEVNKQKSEVCIIKEGRLVDLVVSSEQNQLNARLRAIVEAVA